MARANAIFAIERIIPAALSRPYRTTWPSQSAPTPLL
jgi:hypothetical protein